MCACVLVSVFVVTASYAARVPENSDGYFSVGGGRLTVMLCKSVPRENGPSLQVNDQLAARFEHQRVLRNTQSQRPVFEGPRPLPHRHRILFAAISAA